MYTNTHLGQSCFNGLGLGGWWVLWVLGQQAWSTKASSLHRRFNYFTLSQVWFPLPTDHCGRLGPHCEVYQAVLRAVPCTGLHNSPCKMTRKARLSSSHSQSKTGLKPGHTMKNQRNWGSNPRLFGWRSSPINLAHQCLWHRNPSCGALGRGVGVGRAGVPRPSPHSALPPHVPIFPLYVGLASVPAAWRRAGSWSVSQSDSLASPNSTCL